MLTLSESRKLIEQEISHNPLLQVRPPHRLYEPLKYILELGGKRLRPSMVLLACNLFTENYIQALPAALAIEVFHNFTLIHDDIMDRSDLRRGNPTVHKKWDENVAILAGDAMAILSYQLLAQTQSTRYSEILHSFNKLAIEVCEGQQFDMDFENLQEVPLQDYLRMIELKTSVLIAGSLKIGAIIGDASPEDADRLYEFGRNIGLAFQIQDDYLDVFGDPKHFQKVLGGDIAANKKTFLTIQALEKAQGKEAAELKQWFRLNPANPEEKIQRVTEILRDLGIDQLARAAQEAYYEQAFDAFNELNLPSDRKSVLKDFAVDLLKRNH